MACEAFKCPACGHETPLDDGGHAVEVSVCEQCGQWVRVVEEPLVTKRTTMELLLDPKRPPVPGDTLTVLERTFTFRHRPCAPDEIKLDVTVQETCHNIETAILAAVGLRVVVKPQEPDDAKPE